MSEPNVYVTNIEQETVANEFYRKVLFTSINQQLVLMSIKPESNVKYEIHKDNDQFVRVEKGTGLLVIGPNKEIQYDLTDGTCAIIPMGTHHQIINTSKTDSLKLYTIYSPPHHPPDEIVVDRPITCGNNINNNSQEGGRKLVEYRRKNYMH